MVVAIPFSPRLLRKKSQYSEYLSVFSPSAEKCRKNADQNNSKYELFYAEDVCNKLL